MIERKHFYWLDLIRFVAAFMVMAGHLRGAFFVEYGLLPIAQQSLPIAAFYSLTRVGHEAVLIFFVLSGYLVGGKTIERIKSQNFNIASYAIDRFARIMVPLASSLILVIFIYSLIGKEIEWLILIGNLLSLQGILVSPISDPLWSLSYEVWFYISLGGFGIYFINKWIIRTKLTPWRPVKN